jgi:peptidyl-prolyl cis-trans isomerase D
VKAFAAKEAARIDKFYQDNAARFDQPKKVRASHILVRVGDGVTDEAARKKLEAAAARLQKGEDFAKVAAAVSEDDNTKARGGDVGFFASGTMEQAFADAAFALQPGQVSAPVKTAAGWHLIKVTEVVQPKKVTLEEARPEIAGELLQKDRIAALLREKAEAALKAAKGGKALADLFPTEEAAKKAGRAPVKLGNVVIAADSTGPFAADAAFVPKIGQAADLAAAALAAAPGQVLPKVYETPAGLVVAAVESREKPDPARYDAQRDDMAARLRNRRESQVQSAWLKALRDASEVTVNPEVTKPMAVTDAG